MARVAGKDLVLKMGKTSLYINERLYKLLPKYIDRYMGISRSVTIIADRYIELMTILKRTLIDTFTPKELKALSFVCTGMETDPASIIPNKILNCVIDEGSGFCKQFGVEFETLVEKLKKLDTGSQFALYNLIEELNISVQNDNIPPMGAAQKKNINTPPKIAEQTKGKRALMGKPTD